MTRDIVEWSYPTRVVFGTGAAARLPDLCRELGIAAPLLVTDAGLADAGIVQDAMAGLRDAGLAAEMFAGVRSNPTASDVASGVAVFAEGGHDGVVAFGGGSALDAGKAIAFMKVQTRPIWDFEDVGYNWKRAETQGLAPVVAVPTTAGTGSEVGRASVVTDVEAHEKKVVFHPAMMPRVALMDPALTRGLPAHLTAATGFDAFVHSFEAFCAPGFHPIADGIALEGLRLIAGALPRAVADGGDMAARADMMAAAAMGAAAFQKGLGGVHALAHAVGALYDTHHGLTNAVLLPYVMQANRGAIEDRMVRLSHVLDLSPPGYDAVFAKVLELRRGIAIPDTLEGLVADTTKAEEIGERATRDPCAGGNPVALEAADYTAIFQRAMSGVV